ncbi:cell division initiation protein [Humidesulfovibrio mexicanus]|uniref:Cell division initiation protein n=1 Tax=Humidesulfovibrio mexicanus TaxID=147047 RepID=A0A238XRI1_9BACT|nr:DivIVA domain-containing protein [Humidesulfovibrio mexicanus]SNR61330.1 cell division initiation protein [Humidesulfovibrio mexicanus]
MTISKIDLLNRKFSKKLWGYAPEEVDQLMAEVAEMLGAVAEERKNLIKKVRRMEASVEEFRQRDETLRDTLMSTQKMVDDIKGGAQREAQLILDEARAKAEGMVQQGHNRLAQLYEDIENLKRQRSQFDIQLRGLLETHLRILESDDPAENRLETLESKLKYLRKAE